MVLNLVLAAVLVGPLDLEVRGLALALSLATIAEFLTLFYLIARRMPRLLDASLLSAIGRMVLATALMAAVVRCSRPRPAPEQRLELPGWRLPSPWARPASER